MDSAEPEVFESRVSLHYLPEVSADGKCITVLKDINTVEDPLVLMSFDDFAITKLLKAGIPLKHLLIQSDTRLGVTDADIDDFNHHLSEIASDLFDIK